MRISSDDFQNAGCESRDTAKSAWRAAQQISAAKHLAEQFFGTKTHDPILIAALAQVIATNDQGIAFGDAADKILRKVG